MTNESQFVSPRQTIERPSRAAHIFRSSKNELSLQSSANSSACPAQQSSASSLIPNCSQSLFLAHPFCNMNEEVQEDRACHVRRQSGTRYVERMDE